MPPKTPDLLSLSLDGRDYFLPLNTPRSALNPAEAINLEIFKSPPKQAKKRTPPAQKRQNLPLPELILQFALLLVLIETVLYRFKLTE